MKSQKILLLMLLLSGIMHDAYGTKRKKDIIDTKRQQHRSNNDEFIEEPISQKYMSTVNDREVALNLIDRAQAYFKGHVLEQSCHVFSKTREFVVGDIGVFLLDADGVCLAHRNSELLWQNLMNMEDAFGVQFIRAMIEYKDSDEGTVTYHERGTAKTACFKRVFKNGKQYIIGSSFYPHSKESAVVNLVRGAVALFSKGEKEGRKHDTIFSDMSYPLGRFSYGDLYLYVLDFKGLLLAQGDRPQLIGTNAWNYKDEKGKLVNQEIINRLKDGEKDVWVEYMSKGALKRAYAEKVTDKAGNSFAIVAGYYPNTTQQAARDLVRKAYTYMKQNGKSAAVEVFTNVHNNEFRYGDLFIVVYSGQGVSIAHGGNPELVGVNHLEAKDDTGKFVIKELIKEANKDGQTWITCKKNKLFQIMYAQKIDIGSGSYYISTLLYPITKQEMVDLLLQAGIDYLNGYGRKEAFGEFVKKDGQFIVGDLNLFVFDTQGICYAYGDNYDLIWRHLLSRKDDVGKEYVKLFVNEAGHGPTKITYRLYGRNRIAQVQSITKNDKQYIIGSEFYV